MVWGFGMLTKKSWDTLTFRSQIKISSPFQFSPTFNKSQAIWKQKKPFKISRKKVVLVFLVTSNLPTIFSRLNPPFLFLRTGHGNTQKNKGLPTTQRRFPWVFWNFLYRNRGFELEGAELKKWTDQLLKKTSKGKEVIMRRCFLHDTTVGERMGGEKLSQYT